MSRMADEMQTMFNEQFDEQFGDANQELEQMLEHAIRECMTKGVSIDNIKLLCQQTGIKYAHIVGEKE